MTVLQIPPRKAIDSFLSDCSQLQAGNIDLIREIALASIRYYTAGKKDKEKFRVNQDLENRWYQSLDMGIPDFGVYGSAYYLADLWACWIVYSRRYLLSIQSVKTVSGLTILNDLGGIRHIADLGCGIGYTTAALKGLFPDAKVVGTNLDGTVQTRFARKMGKTYGFDIVPDIARIGGYADFVFASEYFEHILDPITHLNEVCTILRPKAFLIANAFGTISIGHFRQYSIKGAMVDGKDVPKLFDRELRSCGYEKVKTHLWNNRPTYWRLTNGT